ncbi:MAG TPA: ribosome silencing factor [Syntrophorhabdaceae bacterium]|jgi:ribosome-associated protein|nr:ribosome silencing factor [Syntrophorhabdaceae bacterium]MDI9560850.1 ribosome silencing factor [Pseudomonadota bacterium]OQC49250.1 MAG: Ribosomal silencing factor RsfS [Deltaproteobacteria bacterium ADurb.Bin026]HOS58729.1 ribosome silencing factor [Syntrophorhabdaceae bacterium]HPN98254.1 ribosome silencing factor [Syntrophorhabdaceae bacterium]
MELDEKIALIARYAEEKKAKDILMIELKGLTDIADYFVIASGASERHVKTIVEYIETSVKKNGILPYSVEGYNEGRWVIIDYRNIIVHVFLEHLRELYDLESLWIEAKRYTMTKEKTTNTEVKNGKRKT